MHTYGRRQIICIISKLAQGNLICIMHGVSIWVSKWNQHNDIGLEIPLVEVQFDRNQMKANESMMLISGDSIFLAMRLLHIW